MRPEQRLERAERILLMMVKAGQRARREWRQHSREQHERSREQGEKINILISMHLKNEEQWRAKSDAVDEQIKALAVAQAELTKSQNRTDRTLRAFISSLRKGGNGNSSN